LLIYSKTISPRLQFITDFIFREILNEEYELTTDSFWFTHHVGNKINYSNESLSEQEFRIGNVSMLFQNEIIDQEIECFEWNGQKAFFKTDGDIPFDIFAAVFYLISRYEEYLPHDKDAYGRYAHSNSLAFTNAFLHLPLVDIWLEEFKKSLLELYPSLRLKKSIFSFTPTYDIDIAWSYLHKGWKRTIGASVKDIISLRWKKLIQRNKVLFGIKTDPYDVYDWLDAMHAQYDLSPHYFFLVAEKYSRYDKNNPIDSQAMQDLIKRHDQEYKVGIHPSWQSGDDLLKIKNEILQLVKIAEEKIDSSRQHYIRFSLPDTYRHLIDAGIETDFSMGYGSVNGFRASTSKSFYWYDIKNEMQTELLLTPFCFMDANSFYEQRYTPIQALEEMNHYFEVLKSVNGNLVTIWHNTILGTESMYKGWRETYEKFVKEVSSYISSQ
jgi:hypothetical protein